MSVAIIDYGSGNLRSAEKSFMRVAQSLEQTRDVCVVNNADAVAQAEAIVLPGVGAFADCMAGLAAIDGLCEALDYRVRQCGRPFLGICVGMQLLFTKGLEEKTTQGLGWLQGDIIPLDIIPLDKKPSYKIPHMGWNEININKPHKVFNALDGKHGYFVHSYCAAPADEAVVYGTCDYGTPLVACVAQDTFCGTQFHPEKSQSVGLQFIKDFLAWRP
ncbi:MAG: imidazole glycerol phosphate synthase subunit HisH [Alphaproteobacteria bacterium]|nr:imidazole glycerol phosphate synthase subunit HisH [Alphaproteobacteria bacterium]MBE8219678.1 imidazole glycerol phosphate synthase subunit HisH [Alphaproteobacteria bacterium]